VRRDRTPRSTQRPPSTKSRFLSAVAAVSALIVGILCVNCGKKGPPLPPLLRLPAPPAEISAERRGDDVIVQFNVPAANTDNTRPGNVSRVEVYGFTGATTLNDEELVKHGTKVGSVDVKAPRDPNQTVEPDESAADLDPLEGTGLDQGARARVEERLTAAALRPVAVVKAGEKPRRRADTIDTGGPLLGPVSPGVRSRTYVAVGINTHGKKGPASRRVAVPLVPPPPPPPAPTVTYDETAITVAWRQLEPLDTDLLPSHPLGVAAPTLGYHVYEVPALAASGSLPLAVAGANRTPPDAPTGAGVVETRLTKAPIGETQYTDSRITWGAERCYAVRAVETIGTLGVESDERAPACVTLKDTFPPAPPKGLRGVASEGAISLIWDPSSEKDLAGYLVLRAVAPGATLEPVTPAPIEAATFNDTVQPGVRYVYAVVAVDKAGNRSAPSNRFEEAAR